MSLSVQITKDELGPLVQGLPAMIRGDGLKRAMGRGVANAIRMHFAGLNQTRPNKMGWRRQNYWAQAARSVSQPKLVKDGLVVSINQPGIGARYLGPTTIRPVAAKTLAIPAQEEAYGTRPRDARWAGLLAFKMVGGRHMALVATENFMRVVTKGKRAGQRVRAAAEKATAGAFEVVFWLRRKVTIQQDKSVLPTETELRTAAVSAANDYVAAKLADPRAGGPTS